MTRRTRLILDVGLLVLLLYILTTMPSHVERLLAMYFPYVVDCTKTLQPGEYRTEMIRADGRPKLRCK